MHNANFLLDFIVIIAKKKPTGGNNIYKPNIVL